MTNAILADLDATRSAREELYKWFHQHAEISMQEDETRARIHEELEKIGFDVQEIGGGVVGTFHNGEGATVMARADFDGLPVQDQSGKDYGVPERTVVNKETGETVHTMHACGHDFHITSLLSTAAALVAHKDAWSGTFIALFQPGEELALGAQSMVDDGLVDKVEKPDVVLVQHVMSIPAGAVELKAGPTLSSSFSVEVTLPGAGTHGSMPEKGIDPVVLASNVVMQLQTIVSRRTAISEPALLTVGAIHAGSVANTISDHATLLINTRSYSEAESKLLRTEIERITRAACQGAGSPSEPTFRYYANYPLTVNDADATAKVAASFREFYGDKFIDLDKPQSASEDFSIIPNAFGVPYVYWMWGGFEDLSTAYGNHSPFFAPDLQPTLDTGLQNIIVAASNWLQK
ncbi:amidohydrolase [Neoactinobaculum massilliense]|uniref:amidohydrolase n=1 Tax=Neoactinobaculum massilliense TaxID=2364794 RepID=UPI000F52BB97|nr:amidohydrolase [Neoactinobaculum massilliense]